MTSLVLLGSARLAAQERDMVMEGHDHHMMESGGVANSAKMMMMMMRNPMLPGLNGVIPSVGAFLPGADLDVASLPAARPREILTPNDGDTLTITAGFVRRTINGKSFVMYGFNGQYPGPLLRVDQHATIHVNFVNQIDLPSSIHWHGLRLDNRFDGAPGVTQDPVLPGENFWYQVYFPDPGIYWYHPHVREDVQQDLGLYGNMQVNPEREGYYNPVNREEFLVLDDLLIDGDVLVPYGEEGANFVIMGRFGNVLLVNGETSYELGVRAGEVVRFYITNVSNTRTFNLTFGGAPIKLIAADLGKFEQELRVENVVIAPAQRYVVEVHFPEKGDYALSNRIQALNHMMGEFSFTVDTLGAIRAADARPEHDYAALFTELKEDPVVVEEMNRFRPHFERPVDEELLLTVAIRDLPIILMQFISIDTMYRPPVEWTDGMPNMNWLSTTNEVQWVLRDVKTKAENMDISWQFRVGDVVKIRLRNDPDAFHPMNHPVHLHGQRFVVVARDGVPNENLVWKDTEIVPVGSTVDILLELSNPGKWMLHCHIAEHIEAGMMMVFDVQP